MEQAGSISGSKAFASREQASENQYARQKVCVCVCLYLQIISTDS